MALGTTDKTEVVPTAEKKIRKQWKSFSIDRSISNPGPVLDLNLNTTNMGGESPVKVQYWMTSSQKLKFVDKATGKFSLF